MNIAAAGPAVPGVFAALGAGLLSFLSPCVLPLIPVYLSFISGESIEILKTSTRKKGALIIRTVLFIAGFTLVFTALGLIFGGGMRFLGSSAGVIINRVAGVLVIAMALHLAFDFIPFLRTEKRISEPGAIGRQGGGAGVFRPLLMGMAFAAGWTPCIGPMLSSILMYAGGSGNIAHAGILLGAYSAGLGIPFLLTGVFFERMTPLLGWMKKHFAAIKILSAVLLASFGIVMLAGGLSGITVFFIKIGYALQEYSESGSGVLRPIASFLAGWFLFQGI